MAKKKDVTLEPRSGQGSSGARKIAVPDDYKKITGIIEGVILSKKLNVYHERKSFSTGSLIAGEFERLGHPVEFIGKIMIANVKDKKLLFLETETTDTSLLGYRVLKNKNFARRFFEKAGVSVARGEAFSRNKMKQAKKFALSLTSAVVKPVDGNKAKGVTVGVKSNREFKNAWASAVKVSKRGVLVEEHFTGGDEARFLVVGQRCAAVFKKIPPHVLGNGLDTVLELIERKNKLRSGNPHLCRRLIELDEHRLIVLKQQGYEPSSIPPKGAVVVIDWKANTSTGGDSIDLTDEVHPSFKQVAERAAGAVPGLDVIGVDILSFGFTQEATKDNYIVIEANTRPGLGGHLYPVYGTPRNVARDIVEYTLNKNRSN
ncbi:MAG: hypothetical protein GX881_09805 [Firmicutes bacterium]|nr:hypothetical protein [Bacillota bacterium]